MTRRLSPETIRFRLWQLRQADASPATTQRYIRDRAQEVAQVIHLRVGK